MLAQRTMKGFGGEQKRAEQKTKRDKGNSLNDNGIHRRKLLGTKLLSHLSLQKPYQHDRRMLILATGGCRGDAGVDAGRFVCQRASWRMASILETCRVAST